MTMSDDGIEIIEDVTLCEFRTVAERNEGLSDFWDKGYNFGLETAIGQIAGEARWQTELKMRSKLPADDIVDRLVMLANILQGFKKPEADDA